MAWANGNSASSINVMNNKQINLIASLYEGRTNSSFKELVSLDDYDKQQIKEIITHGESIQSIVDELVEYVESEELI